MIGEGRGSALAGDPTRVVGELSYLAGGADLEVRAVLLLGGVVLLAVEVHDLAAGVVEAEGDVEKVLQLLLDLPLRLGRDEQEDEPPAPRAEQLASDGARRPSLGEHLEWQLQVTDLDAQEMEIATWIIGNLDERGFLRSTVEELSRACGATGILVLFSSLFYRGIVAARSAQDRLGTYACMLVVAWLAGQMAVNVGMVLGRLPTIGVPLPLVSYGGSSLVATMCGIAVIVNVRSRRFVN